MPLGLFVFLVAREKTIAAGTGNLREAERRLRLIQDKEVRLAIGQKRIRNSVCSFQDNLITYCKYT